MILVLFHYSLHLWITSLLSSLLQQAQHHLPSTHATAIATNRSCTFVAACLLLDMFSAWRATSSKAMAASSSKGPEKMEQARSTEEGESQLRNPTVTTPSGGITRSDSLHGVSFVHYMSESGYVTLINPTWETIPTSRGQQERCLLHPGVQRHDVHRSLVWGEASARRFQSIQGRPALCLCFVVSLQGEMTWTLKGSGGETVWRLLQSRVSLPSMPGNLTMRLLYDQDPNQRGMLQFNQGATSTSRSKRTSNGGQGVSASRGRRHQKSKKEEPTGTMPSLCCQVTTTVLCRWIRRGGDRGARPEHLPEYVAVARSARSDLPGDECCRPTLRMAHG